MTSEEIRARIAALEAQARARAQAEQGADGQQETHRGRDEEPWPWDLLFDLPQARLEQLEGNDFSLESWLSEGLKGLRGYLRGAGLDEEFWGHMRAAEREMLLAWRCLIEARLRRLKSRTETAQPDLSRRQNIEVKFE